MPDKTLVHRLCMAGLSEHGIHFAAENTTFSYREILDRACRAADTLRQAGVEPGERVAIIIPTCIEFLDAFFGCLVWGAVPVPLYPPLRLGRLDEYHERTAAMCASVSAATIVAAGAVRGLIGQVVGRVRPKHGVIAAESLSLGTPLEPILTQHASDLAMIQFSSGTTAHPRPIGLTHQQIQANLDAFLQVMAPFEPARPLGVSWLPLYHDLGLIGFLLGAVCRAGPLVLLRPERFLAHPHIWLQAISRFRATISAAPNFAYAYCVDRIDDAAMEGCDLSSWQIAMNGSEQVSADALRRFTERFGRWGFRPEALCPVYGLAEACVGVTVSPLGHPPLSRIVERAALARGEAVAGQDLEIVSVGRPLPGVEVQVRGPRGSLGEKRVGNIWLRGPSLCSSYTDDCGWLDSGDVGFLWDGDLYVSGRAKDVIILHGANHAPHDIERVVEGVPDIRNGRVAAVARPGLNGETLLVLAEARRLRAGLEDECRRAVMGALGVAAEIRLLAPGTLPRTSSGKLRRAEALRRFESGTLTPPRRMTPLRMGRAWLDSMKGYRKARD